MIPWRRKWQPNPVFLPGEVHGQRSLMGYSPWGHKRVRQDLATKHKQTLLPPWTPQNYNHLESTWVFPGGSDGKEFACSGGDLGWIPGLGRSPGGWLSNPLQYSCLENPHAQRSLGGYSPWGHQESDMTDQQSTAHHREVGLPRRC